MESDELRLVRSIFAARERGEYGSADWADPEIEYVLADGPAPTTFHGLDEMARGIRDFLSAWEGFRTIAEGYRELGEHRILVLLTLKGRGKMSGLDLDETQTKGADVFHLRNGRVIRIVHYFDRQRALDELGLASDRGTVDI